MLASTAGLLDRTPRSGGAITPMLKPTYTVGPLVVGKIMAQAWRELADKLVRKSADDREDDDASPPPRD